MDKIAISVHLEIDPGASDAQEILRLTTMMLRNDYGVHETTVQIEGYQPELCDQCVQPRWLLVKTFNSCEISIFTNVMKILVEIV